MNCQSCGIPVCKLKNGGNALCSNCIAKLPWSLREKLSTHYFSGRNRNRFVTKALDFLKERNGKLIEQS